MTPSKYQLCTVKFATIDGKTQMGPWASMCDLCHKAHGCGLGLGKGQRLTGGVK